MGERRFSEYVFTTGYCLSPIYVRVRTDREIRIENRKRRGPSNSRRIVLN